MTKKASSKNNFNYEENVAQVEEIIEQIESGKLPLEQIFEEFNTAIEKLRQCETFLNKGKQQMNLLIETLENDT